MSSLNLNTRLVTVSAALKSNAPATIIAVDGKGVERWFEKKKLAGFEVVGGTVLLTLPAADAISRQMLDRPTLLDVMVEAIRADEVVGNGTCSTVDEAMT